MLKLSSLFFAVGLFMQMFSVTLYGQQRPNFIIIIADDMAWGDCGAYGHPSIKTPHLDQLAMQGIRFDNAYLTTSSCSPSRASILTGRYPHNTGAPELHSEMDSQQVLLTDVLRKAGYFTASVGKWHLGKAARDKIDLVVEDRHEGGASLWIKTLRDRPQDQPFFLWFAAHDPHRPYQDDTIQRVNKTEDVLVPPYYPDCAEVRRDLADYYDEISRLDHYVGQVCKELQKQGLVENTFVLFMSDNGRPFPMCKTRLTDEGIQTPFIVSFPAMVKAGVCTQSLVSAVDIMPTVLELAGVPIPDTVQGKSFQAILKNPQTTIRDYVFAEHNWHDYKSFERAVRDGNLTYIRNYVPEVPGTPPADGVKSPTYQKMRVLRDENKLTPLQMDSFVVPRPQEFLYDNQLDPYSQRNLALDPAYASALERLRDQLDAWILRTSDKMPEELTPDKFDRETGDLLPEFQKKFKKKQFIVK